MTLQGSDITPCHLFSAVLLQRGSRQNVRLSLLHFQVLNVPYFGIVYLERTAAPNYTILRCRLMLPDEPGSTCSKRHSKGISSLCLRLERAKISGDPPVEEAAALAQSQADMQRRAEDAEVATRLLLEVRV